MINHTELVFPLQLTTADLELLNEGGTVFASIKKFTMQTIITALNSSMQIRGEADEKIRRVMKETTGKNVNVVIYEKPRFNNAFRIYSSSKITF